MMRRLFLNLTCNCFQSKLFVVRAEIRRYVGLGPELPQQMWISKDEYELFESVEQTLPRLRECAVGRALRRQVEVLLATLVRRSVCA